MEAKQVNKEKRHIFTVTTFVVVVLLIFTVKLMKNSYALPSLYEDPPQNYEKPELIERYTLTIGETEVSVFNLFWKETNTEGEMEASELEFFTAEPNRIFSYNDSFPLTRDTEITDKVIQNIIYLNLYNDLSNFDIMDVSDIYKATTSIKLETTTESGTDTVNTTLGEAGGEGLLRNFIIQYAIWKYTGKVTDSTTSNYIIEYATDLIKEATTASNIETVKPSYTLNLNSSNFTISDDSKYYISDLIEITNTKNTILTGEFDYSQAPSGTTAINEGTKEVVDSLSLIPTKFRIKVPVESVTANNKKFNVNIEVYLNSYYDKYSYYYTAGDDSAPSKFISTAIGISQKSKTEKLAFEITPKVAVPNTKQNTSKIIYIIGIAIVLFGITLLLYSNILKKES